MKAKQVRAEVTLIAFEKVDGKLQIADIVTTSRKFAYGFMRRWYRDSSIIEVAALKPKAKLLHCHDKARLIFRTGSEIQSNIGKYETGYRF